VSHVTDVGALERVIRSAEPDYIFHLAGLNVSRDPTEFYRINTQFAVALLKALDETGHGDRPLLLVGTSAEYGAISEGDLPISEDLRPRPYNHYGISKLAQTLEGLAANRSGRPVAVVRPFNLVGPGMPDYLVIQSFVRQISEIVRGTAPPVISVGNLKPSRDFMDVRDAVAIYWQVLRNPACYGKILNVCTGRGTAVDDALRTLIRLAGVEAGVRTEPSRLKDVEILAHYGSPAELTRLVGPVTMRPLESSLNDILQDAMVKS
jgi:GDP-4-dehydro-6-deoxy-D-mannose reductase